MHANIVAVLAFAALAAATPGGSEEYHYIQNNRVIAPAAEYGVPAVHTEVSPAVPIAAAPAGTEEYHYIQNNRFIAPTGVAVAAAPAVHAAVAPAGTEEYHYIQNNRFIAPTGVAVAAAPAVHAALAPAGTEEYHYIQNNRFIAPTGVAVAAAPAVHAALAPAGTEEYHYIQNSRIITPAAEYGPPAVAVAAAPAVAVTRGLPVAPVAVVKPHIPVIKRTEVRDDAGQFDLSYLSADGTSVAEQGVLKAGAFGPVLAKSGTYSYISPEGIPITTSYIADELGFRAAGTHLPVAPSAPAVL